MTTQAALEVPLEVLGLAKEESEVSLFLAIAALGRTLQQLVSLEDTLYHATSGSLCPLGPPPRNTQQHQLAHCLQSLFSASVQLRQQAELNEAAAQELSTHPTCLELALERQVLFVLELQLSERAAALCASGGRASLPPFSSTVSAIKCAALARLLEVHSGSLPPGQLPPLQLGRGDAPPHAFGGAREPLVVPAAVPALPAPSGAMLAGGLLLLGAQEDAYGALGAAAASGAAAALGVTAAPAGNEARGAHQLEFPRPGFQQPGEQLALEQAATLQQQEQQHQQEVQQHQQQLQQRGAQQHWECLPRWQAMAVRYAQPSFQLLQLSSRALPDPQLTPPTLPLVPLPAAQLAQQLQPQQQQQQPPVPPLPSSFSTPAASRPPQPSAEPSQAELPSLKPPMAVLMAGSQLSPLQQPLSITGIAGGGAAWQPSGPKQGPGRAAGVGAGQLQPFGQQGAEGGGGGQGALVAGTRGAKAAEQLGGSELAPALLPYWSALRGDAAPSTSTEGSDPSQPSGPGLPLSPGATTAAAAALAAEATYGSPDAAARPPLPLPAAPHEGARLGAGLGALPAGPSVSAALPVPQQQPLPQQQGWQSETGDPHGGEPSQPLGSMLLCTLQPPSRAANPRGGGQHSGLAAQVQGRGPGGRGLLQRAQDQMEGQDGSNGFRFPSVPAPQGARAGVAPGPLFAVAQGAIGIEASTGAAAPAPAAPVGALASGRDVQEAAVPRLSPHFEAPQLSPPLSTAAGAGTPRDGHAKPGWQGARRENNENFNSSQSQEEQLPVTQPAEAECAPDAPPSLPGGFAPARPGTAPFAAAPAAVGGGGTCCGERSLAGAQLGVASAQPKSPGALATLAEMRVDGGRQQEQQQQQAEPLPASQPWPSGEIGATTPAAAALLMDSQRDSNSPHRKQALPGLGGRGSGGSGSGRCSGMVPLPLGQAVADGDAAGAGGTVLHTPQDPVASGPDPARLVGLLSAAAATRKRALSQDADGGVKRSRFAIESQEAAERLGEEREAARAVAAAPASLVADKPAGSPVGEGGQGKRAAAAAAEGTRAALPSTVAGAAAALATLGLGWAGQLGSEGDGGIMCTQPPCSSQEQLHAAAAQPPGTGGMLAGSLAAPGAGQAASDPPASLAAAWEALALAEQWAAVGTPHPLAGGLLSALRPGSAIGPAHGPGPEGSPIGGTAAGHPTPARRLGSGLAQGAATPGLEAGTSASKFAGAAPGATPRFVSPSHGTAASPLVPIYPGAAGLSGQQKKRSCQTEQEASPEAAVAASL